MTTLTPYEGRDLPPIIQRAIARINDPAVLQDLSPTQRYFLSVLLRRVSAADSADIFWVKRSNFAKLIKASEATVYRMLAHFEMVGLIQRIAQKRDSEGAFTVGEIRLTDPLCQTIGLTGPSRVGDVVYQKKRIDRLAPVTDVLNNQGVKQFSTKKHSLRESSPNTVGKNTIPPDLYELHQQGLSCPQLFLLMGLATKQGKRLSDIVSVCKTAIRNLKGVELFAYLRALTTAEKDFGFIQQQADLAQQAETLRREQTEKLAKLKAQFCRKWLSGSGDTVFQIDDFGRINVYRTEPNGRLTNSGMMPGMEAEENFWNRVIAGDFKVVPTPPMENYLH